MVVSVDERRTGTEDRGDMASKGVLFDFTFLDLKTGAHEGCDLCNWVLNEECISRTSIIRQVPDDLPEGDTFQGVILALQDSAMWLDKFLGEPSPADTFRGITQDASLDGHRLFAATGERIDILTVEFFGLWNPVSKKIDYRTRHGFKVFTNPEDPAATRISTRPIENDPESDRVFHLISSWMQQCREDHPQCRPNSDTMPARLIEIVEIGTKYRLRLQHTDNLGSVPFVALSYCWGGDQPVMCWEHLVPRFSIAIPFADLPATVQDAISVCRRIGIKYIWIDALCIIQDDRLDQAVEIAKMPYIYGNANFTIAAAQSRSASEGFLQNRYSVHPAAFKLPYRCSDDQIGSITLVGIDESPEPIDERGWTLQERLLSSRTIEFGSRQTRWICQESKRTVGFVDGWREYSDYNGVRQDILEIYDITKAKPNSSSLAVIDERPTEELVRRWKDILKSYTRRRLTMPTDRALAISGIAESFGRHLRDQYRAGIWTSEFQAGLLWQVCRDTTRPRPSEYQGPSWSWVSVNGPIEYSYRDFRTWKPETGSAEIIDCSIDLVSNLAPYGAIQEGSGRLRIKAKTAIGAVSKTDGGPVYKDKFMVGFFGRNDSGPCCIGMSEMWPDATDELKRVTVIELRSAITGYAWRCCGLVLREVPGLDGVFQRVGTFEYTTNRNGRLSGETPEQWADRVDMELNWFKNCPETIVEII